MPNNVIDSAKDEKKWKKAEGIAEDKLGHKPKSDKDWAYVMGIYKNMKPDHKFKSEKSASNVVDQWMAQRVAARQKTAGFGLLDQVLDTKGVMDALRHLTGVDDQSADLLIKVVYQLEDAMDLKSSELAALKRMQWVAKNKRGDYAALRNNIFKAANSLGIKLPSGMFASTKTPSLNRTAAEPWVIVYGPRGEKVGMPESWLKGGLSRYDVHAKEVGGSELKRQADLVIGPGTHRSAMKNIDYLHGAVNDIYTLVDEGYVDGKKAITAFK